MNAADFQDKVLEELGAIKAEIKALCKNHDENLETHKEIFNRINAQEVAVAGIKEKTGIIATFSAIVGGAISGLLAWVMK